MCVAPPTAVDVAERHGLVRMLAVCFVCGCQPAEHLLGAFAGTLSSLSSIRSCTAGKRHSSTWRPTE